MNEISGKKLWIIIKQNKSRKTSYFLFSILFLSCKNPCFRLVLTRSEIHNLTTVYISDKRCINYQTKQINIPENDDFHTESSVIFLLLTNAKCEIILCTWFSWVKEWFFSFRRNVNIPRTISYSQNWIYRRHLLYA